MDMGSFNLFIKQVSEEYALDDSEKQRIISRLLADDREFEKVWTIYKRKYSLSGVDSFKPLLLDLLS